MLINDWVQVCTIFCNIKTWDFLCAYGNVFYLVLFCFLKLCSPFVAKLLQGEAFYLLFREILPIQLLHRDQVSHWLCSLGKCSSSEENRKAELSIRVDQWCISSWAFNSQWLSLYWPESWGKPCVTPKKDRYWMEEKAIGAEVCRSEKGRRFFFGDIKAIH